MRNTLLLIFAALALMIGSFIWFVVTWDARAEEPISRAPASSDQKHLPPRRIPCGNCAFEGRFAAFSPPTNEART